MSIALRRLGKYELRENLGRGSTLQVWKALDTESQQYVTIKFFRLDLQNDAHFLMHFESEAKKLVSLHHPNIVQVRDFQIVHQPESESTIAYLVTDAVDLVKELRLADYFRTISSTKKFASWEVTVQLFAAIGKAIDYVHQQGVIHRNINPTNILLDTGNTSHCAVGEPLLTGFGIATILGTFSSPRPGMFQGNPAYMAPEQLQGYPGNELSDLYSLGVILYQICTGALPFQGDNPVAMRMQLANATPTPPALFRPDIPPPLILVLLRCLTKDPAERFPNAAAMTAALAEALNVVPPDDLPLFVPPPDARNMPTYLTSSQFHLPSATIPPSSSWPGMGAWSSSSSCDVAHSAPPDASSAPVSVLPQAIVTTSSSPAPPNNRQGTPTLLSDNMVAVSSGHTSSDIPIVIGKPLGELPAPPSTKSKRRQRGLMLRLIGIVLLLLGGSGLGTFYLLSRVAEPSEPVIVGSTFFLSSGRISQSSDRGLNDGLRITLQRIAAPAPGKSYYAWLLGDREESGEAVVLLGPLSVTNGTANLSYNDKDHNDLLARMSRLLITEEDTSTSPVSPSLDKSTWKYIAEFSQKVAPGTKYSVLDHLRHLLAADPELDALGLRGGLSSWFVRDIDKVLVWAGSARDDWKGRDTQQMRQQLIRILDVLDSAAYVQKVGDVPPGTPLLINTPIALLEFDPQSQDPPGYLEHISQHLKAFITAPGASKTQINLAKEVIGSLNNVLSWLERIHQDAKQLEQISDNRQLLTPASLSTLNDMATEALYAYLGQLDPTTNQVMEGAVQIRNDMARLATFDIRSYKM